MNQYVFRIEKTDPARPFTPTVLAEFGCNADNPAGMIEAVAAFAALLKIHGSPEAVIVWMKNSANFERAKLFVDFCNQ